MLAASAINAKYYARLMYLQVKKYTTETNVKAEARCQAKKNVANSTFSALFPSHGVTFGGYSMNAICKYKYKFLKKDNWILFFLCCCKSFI